MDYSVVYFIHVLGALMVGFYLIMPIVTLTMRGLTAPVQLGFARGMRKLNTIAQWLLIVQFLTGGYLIGLVKGFSVPWMVSVVVVFVLLGAASGMLGVSFKRIVKSAEGVGVGSVASHVTRALLWSIVASLSVLYLTVSMVFPRWI
jgi:hypothetical protein